MEEVDPAYPVIYFYQSKIANKSYILASLINLWPKYHLCNARAYFKVDLESGM